MKTTMQADCPREAQMQGLGNSGWGYQVGFLEEARQEGQIELPLGRQYGCIHDKVKPFLLYDPGI